MTGAILNAAGILIGGIVGLARTTPLSPQTQAFFKTERLTLREVHLLTERFGHAREFQGHEFVECRMVQHVGSPWLVS